VVNDLATEHFFFLVTKIHNEKWRVAEHCKHLLIQISIYLSFLRNTTAGACRAYTIQASLGENITQVTKIAC